MAKQSPVSIPEHAMPRDRRAHGPSCPGDSTRHSGRYTDRRGDDIQPVAVAYTRKAEPSMR